MSKLIQRGFSSRLPPNKRDRPAAPKEQCVVVTCMDTRVNPYRLLSIDEGEVHILRNAGGILTDDIVRSLIVSQRLLSTREILIIQHTECGMCTFEGEQFKDEIQHETGIRPHFDMGTFKDVFDSVKKSVQALNLNPLLLKDTVVRGYVYDVGADALVEI